jgi:ribonuclease BN (tRNA processing enzyme)
MKLLFLGTCACDYSPKLKTDFIDSFDFDARRSSCALLDGRYMIDCGEHALESLKIAKVDFDSISDVFITHLHSDHYNVNNIAKIAQGKKEKLRLWVREDAVVPEIENVEVVYMEETKEYSVSQDVFVKGLKANHNQVVNPQHLLFNVQGKSFLYALDGAWFLNETYYELKKANLDLVVFDATCGDYVGDYRMGEHNSIPMIRLMLPSFKVWGTINENTQIYLSHIAPSLHKPHAEIVKSVEQDGMKVAFDGLEIIV